VARIGRPRANTFPVQWLVSADSPEHESVLADARRELDFYLVRELEPGPWRYAQYHCGTASNVYSHIHWSYFPHGDQGSCPRSPSPNLPGSDAQPGHP